MAERLSFWTVAKNEAIEGEFSLHNNYRTLLFTPKQSCGVNMCEEKMYCLRGGSSFKVVVKAAAIASTSGSSASNLAMVPYTGVVDLSGNSLDGGGLHGAKKDGKAQGSPEDNFEWQFSTTNALDVSVPRVISMNPGRSGSVVDLNAPIEVVFSKPMDMSSLDSSAISLDGGVQFWINSKFDGEQGRTTSLINHDPMSPDTVYSPRVHSNCSRCIPKLFSFMYWPY